MRRGAVFGIVALVGVALVAPAGSVATAAAPERDVIVMLKDSSPSPEGVAAEHAQKRRARVREVYSAALRGYAAKVPADQVAALQADPRVEAVVENEHTSFEEPNVAKKKAGGFPQILPYATDRVDADVSSTRAGDQRGKVDVDVAVIDTGVGPHNDLNVVGGVNCGDAGSSKKDWTDDQGHGTFVAGVVGAADNSRDYVGVAPGARIWSVRVDNQNQDTELANVLCGIEWVIKRSNVIEAVNMSIAFRGSDDRNCGRTNHDPMHRAICRLVGAGVTVAAAAGNEASDTAATTPAAYDEVIAVSAMTDCDGVPGGLDRAGFCATYSPTWCLDEQDDTPAFFTNFGPDIDLIAPGVCVEGLSPFGYDSAGNTFPDPDGYNLLSGTSFSSPHVAGAAALYKSKHHKASPAQVKAALIAAGSYAYDNSDDPDGIKEPLLNVARF